MSAPSTVALSRLFKAVAAGDLLQAGQVARDLAEDEERRGRKKSAAILRASLAHQNGHKPTQSLTQLQPLSDARAGLISEQAGPSLADVVLTASAREELNLIATEWKNRQFLEKKGVPRRSKVLFFGPPGCGKTLAARSLGTALGLPVFTVRLSSLVGAFLGQTGANLRGMFQFAESNPCVLLLDEFDAIARNRGRSQDVGELDRVVISLLQELDHTKPAGIVVAATNTPESLDRAIWRRFELRLEFPRPSKRQLRKFAEEKATGKHATRGATVELPSSVVSFADVDSWWSDRRRRELLTRVDDGARRR